MIKKKNTKGNKNVIGQKTGWEKKRTKIKTSNMKILRDNAFINTEMVTTKMAVMSGYIYIYIYIFIYKSVSGN